MQIFQSLRFAGTLLVTILLARSYFSLSEIGQYEYYLFIAAILLVPLSIGVKNAILASYKTVGATSKHGYLWASYGLLFLVGIFIAISLLIFNQVFDLGIPSFDLLLLIVYVLINVSTILIDAILLLRHEFRKLINYSVVHFLLQVGLLGMVISCNLDFSYLLYYLILFSAIKHVYLLVLLGSNYTFSLDVPIIKNLMKGAIPLIAIALMNYGMETIDGLLVKGFFGLEDFAVFRYGAKELPLTILLVSGMVTALIPVASTQKQETISLIKGKMSKLIHVLFVTSIILILLSPFLFTRVYGHEFRESSMIFNVYLLTLSSRILIPQVFYLSSGRNNFLMSLTFVELLINFCLSLILLKYFGVLGIAIATWLAYLLHKFSLIFFLKRDFDINLSDMIHIPTYLAYNVMLYIAFLISYFIY